MRFLDPADYKVMPWKNGGGTTAEVYMENPGPHGFDWRVSIATVTADGSFSIFAGCDRHIAVIEGEGMTLLGGPRGPIEIWPAYTPRSFSGDWTITGRLRSGPVRDFNLISRRDHCSSQLRCQVIRGRTPASTTRGMRLISCLTGIVDVCGSKLPRGWSALLDPGETHEFGCHGDPSMVAICDFWPNR